MASSSTSTFGSRTLEIHPFRSGKALEQTLLRYIRLSNGKLPQAARKDQTLIEALKNWNRARRQLSKKRPITHAKCDR